MDYWWNVATTVRTGTAYLEFLEKAPRPNEHEAEAKYQAALHMLPDKAGTERCVLGNESCALLWDFLRDYPDTDKAREVSGWVAEFTAVKDDRAYQKALDGGTYLGLLQYLASYPEGRHRAEIDAQVARYRFETLKSPLTFSWRQLGLYPPMDDRAISDRWVDQQMRTGVVLTACVAGNRPVALGQLRIAAAGASFPGGPDIAAVRGILSATEVSGIALLELEAGQCVSLLTTEDYIGVGSRFRIREVKDAEGGILPVVMHGQLVRQGEVTFLHEGLRFEAGTVLLRRRER